MKVWVAAYTHRYGTDVAVYDTYESAALAKAGVATQWWDDLGDPLMPAPPMPESLEERAEIYFDTSDESFSIEEHDILSIRDARKEFPNA